MTRILLAVLSLFASASAASAQNNEYRNPVDPMRPVTILVSIDGFRPDYLERGVTPTLSALAAEGATASMRPSFPSVTFPNHYTLVTGKHPDHHGIVGNSFNDPELGRFTMASKESAWWDQAEPIWITAEKAGLVTGAMFWPGSETTLEGIGPSTPARSISRLRGRRGSNRSWTGWTARAICVPTSSPSISTPSIRPGIATARTAPRPRRPSPRSTSNWPVWCRG